MRTAAKLPIAKLFKCEVWIERRIIGGSNRLLMARMVEWINGDEGCEPVWGKCLLAPNLIYDVDLAKKLVHRYLDSVCDNITIIVNV